MVTGVPVALPTRRACLAACGSTTYVTEQIHVCVCVCVCVYDRVRVIHASAHDVIDASKIIQLSTRSSALLAPASSTFACCPGAHGGLQTASRQQTLQFDDEVKHSLLFWWEEGKSYGVYACVPTAATRRSPTAWVTPAPAHFDGSSHTVGCGHTHTLWHMCTLGVCVPTL